MNESGNPRPGTSQPSKSLAKQAYFGDGQLDSQLPPMAKIPSVALPTTRSGSVTATLFGKNELAKLAQGKTAPSSSQLPTVHYTGKDNTNQKF